jgi:hypothetical protein
VVLAKHPEASLSVGLSTVRKEIAHHGENALANRREQKSLAWKARHRTVCSISGTTGIVIGDNMSFALGQSAFDLRGTQFKRTPSASAFDVVVLMHSFLFVRSESQLTSVGQ